MSNLERPSCSWFCNAQFLDEQYLYLKFPVDICMQMHNLNEAASYNHDWEIWRKIQAHYVNHTFFTNVGFLFLKIFVFDGPLKCYGEENGQVNIAVKAEDSQPRSLGFNSCLSCLLFTGWNESGTF